MREPMAEHDNSPQSPEEIAEIQAANKARRRNINKLTAILIAICLIGLGVFLAVFITLNQNQQTGDNPVTPQTIITSVPSENSQP